MSEPEQGLLFGGAPSRARPPEPGRCSVCWRNMPGRPAEAVALDGWAKVEDAWFCGGCRGPRFTSPFHHFTVGPFDSQRRRTCGICAELWEHPRHHRPERVPERYW